MSKVLYIKANAKSARDSRTYKVSDAFIAAYRESHPEDKVRTIDLYKNEIAFLSGGDISAVFGPKDESSREHPILQYAYQFADADKYVVAAPMWNLGIPAILKAYIDYITVTGVTFKYTATGSVGLCTGKKAVYVTGRGGVYTQGPAAAFEMGDRYLRTIFAFFGILDFQTVAAEGLDVDGADVDGIVAAASEKAQEIAKAF